MSASIYARFSPPSLEAAKGKDGPLTEGHELSYFVPNQLHEQIRDDLAAQARRRRKGGRCGRRNGAGECLSP